ncbi:MAG: phosphoribosylformylglycinamidine synthase [Patescibacteria group bacterium]|nr:phosphoribosylformylglycinamidine synthase [Patescibacteria group bacterium]
MLNFFRAPALSGVKTGLRLAEIQAIASGAVGLKTELSFYVDVKEPLNETENERLRWLLAETFEPKQFGTKSFLEAAGKVIEIGPRVCLVTPWSTSGGTIFEACNLSKIKRIEAARRYCLLIEDGRTIDDDQLERIAQLLHDKMTEQIYASPLATFASGIIPAAAATIPIIEARSPAIGEFAKEYGLGLSADMVDYIFSYYLNGEHRNPTDVELFMFGQLNSNHCRHHDFNAKFTIDGKVMPKTLMQMIKEPARDDPGNLAVAFKDNAAVLQSVLVGALMPAHPETVSKFKVTTVRRGFVLKVETHNHPTTVSPYEGAATGVAVRRDIFGTGRGGVSIGHLAGYYVGNLFIPGYVLPWEKEYIGYSPRFAAPLKIMIEASNGASDNCNCFGNPVVLGTARSFEQMVGDTHYGYRKTVMVAGSFGYIDGHHIKKQEPKKGMLVVQTGGPAFPIGVGGGSGSSKDAGGQELELDFNSVQRGDAFTERGNFNVIRACSESGDDNPIATLTDLGAGGDCTAIPELVFPVGARIELRKIPCGDKTMPVWVFWCNEAQERMAYLIWKDKLPLFEKICARNRCPMAVIGEVTGDSRFVLTDSEAKADAPRERKTPIDVSMDWLLADLPQKEIFCQSSSRRLKAPLIPKRSIFNHLERVFRLVDVGSKEYLTRKADRTVGNRTVRQQEVGPLQLPLADCAVMSDGPFGITGNIIAIGEQPIKGLVDNEAGIRMSIGEAFTNAIWAPMNSLADLNFSATWQRPCGQPGEDARLYQDVRVARKYIIDLQTRIGVGKDSCSMTLKEVEKDGTPHPILAPGTVQMVVFGPCCDINNVITPDIKMPGKSKLMFVDLAKGVQRLGGSALLRVYEQLGNESPDLEDAEFFVQALRAVQKLIRNNLILSGHDRSDGGLIGCVSEMAFAGNCGLSLDLRGSRLGGNNHDQLLFNEELGLVFEFLPKNYNAIRGILRRAGVSENCHVIGKTTDEGEIKVKYNGEIILGEEMAKLREIWRETSLRLDELQATPDTATEERCHTYFRHIGPQYSLSFAPKPTPRSAMLNLSKPKAAVLWEAGINGERDAAEALYLAGFDPWDVCKKDLLSGEATLKDFQLLFLPGGFSFRDTLDAGKGAAGVFKFNPRAADELAAFTGREDTLMFGPCNGCQEMALLGILPWPGIPTEKLPRFIKNKSERFEHRQVSVKILPGSNSVFLKGMEGSVLGIIISHGQGRFRAAEDIFRRIINENLAPVRYVNDWGEITEDYPFNPNGSPAGVAGISSRNGRFLAMMPHPERLPLNNLWPWQPREWKKLKASPWLKLFQNAREWCEQA